MSSDACDALVPLYAVLDRRCSGEWRVAGEYHDLKEARTIAAMLRKVGADVQVEHVPQPLIP